MAVLPEVVVTAKMSPQAKKRLAQRQTAAFNEARAKGHRYFYFNGDWYNTKKKGESDAYWAKHFKDNTTGGGSSNVQTSVGGEWRGKKGVEGTYGDDGKWITFTNASNSGPVEARGNKHNTMRGYIKADLPTDTIVTTTGTDRGKQSTNTRTGVTVGSKIKLTEKEKQNIPHRNPAPTARNINWDAADFVDALMPTNALVNLGSRLWNQATGGEYQSTIAKSGFNPFGWAKDSGNFVKDPNTGDLVNLALRGVDAYTTLGMPGTSKAIDKMGTKWAPKMTQLSSKSTYIPKRATQGADVLPQWHLHSLAGTRAPIEFGKRSIDRAVQSGMQLPKYAGRYVTRAVQNPNTGTAYFFRTPGMNSYDAAIDNAMNLAPSFGFGTNMLIQGQE